MLTNSSPVVHINISMTGVQQLTLLATNGVSGSIDYDHADWAGAELLSVATASAPSHASGSATTKNDVAVSKTKNVALAPTPFLTTMNAKATPPPLAIASSETFVVPVTPVAMQITGMHAIKHLFANARLADEARRKTQAEASPSASLAPAEESPKHYRVTLRQ